MSDEAEVQVAVDDHKCECGAELELVPWPYGNGESLPIVLCPVCDVTASWASRKVKGEPR